MLGVNCLICSVSFNARQDRRKEFVEILSDLFSVFSNYMKWSPPSKYRFDFFHDIFPFCKACDVILVRVLRLHEQILNLQKQIGQICVSVSAKILISEKDLTSSKIDTLGENPGDPTYAIKDEAPTTMKKIEYYRSIVLKGHLPNLELRVADTSGFLQISQAELVLDETTVENSWNDSPGTFEPELQVEDIDIAFEQDSDDDDGNEKSKDTCSERSTVCGAVDHEPDLEVDDSSEPLTPNPMAVPDQALSSDSLSPSDESPYPCKATLFERSKYKGRFTQTAPNVFLLDSKCSFSHENNQWKCLACNTAFFLSHQLLGHLTSPSCPGVRSATSCKTLTYKMIKYDKLKNGNFECRRCPFTSLKRSEIQSHINSLHVVKGRLKLSGEDKIKMAQLKQSGPNLLIMNGQFEIELLKKGKFKCALCSKISSTRKGIVSHIFTSHAPKSKASAIRVKTEGLNKYSFDSKYCCEFIDGLFKCCECSYSSKTITRMKLHMRYEHIKSMSKLVCETCGFSCYRRNRLEYHQLSHADDRHVKCTYCTRKFKSKNSLNAHKYQQHFHLLNVTTVLCEVCGKEFGRQCDLNAHVRDKHAFVNCQICSKQYHADQIAVHMQSHAQNKFECFECSKKFTYRMSLSTHKKSCKGDKPYSCSICDMKFTQSYSVTRHKNVVHNTSTKAKTTNKSLKRTKGTAQPGS